MSHTVNTMPSFVALIDARAVDHVCGAADRCPLYDRRRWWHLASSCTPDWDHPAWVNRGGARAGQSGWATLRQRQHRAALRAHLRTAERYANTTADPDELWDIDIDPPRRSISWDMW